MQKTTKVLAGAAFAAGLVLGASSMVPSGWESVGPTSRYPPAAGTGPCASSVMALRSYCTVHLFHGGAVRRIGDGNDCASLGANALHRTC